MLAWWAPWRRFTRRLTPPVLELWASVDALKDGLNESALQLATWKKVDVFWLASRVDVDADSVASAPQLWG